MTDISHRPASWVLTWSLLAVLCGCTGTTYTGSSASCAAPGLTTVPDATAAHPGPGPTQREPITVSPGQALQIYGSGYQTCHDTNHQPSASPFTGLTLFVTQGHNRQALGTVSAKAPGGTFAVTVRLPQELQPGPATIRTSQSVETPIHLHVRQRTSTPAGEHRGAISGPLNLVLAASVSLFSGPGPAAVSELFPTNIRNSALSIPYNVSTAIFGGFAPFIATLLIQTTGNCLSFTFCVIVAAIVSFLAIATVRDRSKDPLR